MSTLNTLPHVKTDLKNAVMLAVETAIFADMDVDRCNDILIARLQGRSPNILPDALTEQFETSLTAAIGSAMNAGMSLADIYATVKYMLPSN